MHKFIIFGRENCQFTKKAINEEIKDNCIFISTDDYDILDEPFRSIIKSVNHVTSPCIFKVEYLGGNRELIGLHNQKGEVKMRKHDYVIYGRDSCPYTVDSLDKLDKWELYYQYIQVSSIPNEKMTYYYYEIAKKLKHKTAPCIFIVKYIGTCSQLIKLNEKWVMKDREDKEKHAKAVEYVERMNSSPN